MVFGFANGCLAKMHPGANPSQSISNWLLVSRSFSLSDVFFEANQNDCSAIEVAIALGPGWCAMSPGPQLKGPS
jgi:hypothetical protein